MKNVMQNQLGPLWGKIHKHVLKKAKPNQTEFFTVKLKTYITFE